MTIQFLLLLFGFSAVITQEVNIRCYGMVTVNGQLYPGSSHRQVDCRAEYDRCGTVTYTRGSENIRMMNCTRSSTDCDDQSICDVIRARARAHGLPDAGCVVACCDSDLCNAPDKKKDELKPGEKDKKHHKEDSKHHKTSKWVKFILDLLREGSKPDYL